MDSTQQFLFAPFYNDGTIGVYFDRHRWRPRGHLRLAFWRSAGCTVCVAANPNGQFIYVTDTLTVPGTTPGTVNEFSYDGTGALTLLHSYTVGVNPYGVAIDPSGQFLYVANGDGTVSGFTVAPTTGVPDVHGRRSAHRRERSGEYHHLLAIDPSSQYLYVTTGDAVTNGSSIIVFTITPGTGVPMRGRHAGAGDQPRRCRHDGHRHQVIAAEMQP